MIVATADGLLSFSTTSRQMRHLVFPLRPEQMINRFLGATCDPKGRLWSVAAKTPGRSDSGGLYCFTPGDVPHKVAGLDPSGDGLIWDREGRFLYFTDTAAQRIDALIFDPNSCELIGRKTVITFPPGHDGPKGGTIDAEGKIWVAHWRGGCVSRWDPHTGRCLGRVDVPAPGVTSCTFGGENLKTLYITTSREGIDPEMLEISPRSGGLFACRPGIAGIPAHGFAG
jgi:sugar lactone lactonase YvrE